MAYLREAETLRFEGYACVGRRAGKGTSEVMRNENEARDRFYNKMSICEAPSMSIKEKRQMRKRFSEEFYKV